MRRCCFHNAGAGAPLLAAIVAAATAGAFGCDGSYQAFLGAVPEAPGDSSEPVDVLLGIDGLSRQAFDRARTRGAFTEYAAADLITVFPGTSDYAWTRTTRAGSLGGYEIGYFDADRNQIESGGLAGVVEHPLREGIAGTFPCYQRFDFVGDGETWQPAGYLDPLGTFGATLDELFNTVAGRARTQRDVLAYLMTVDVVSHVQGLEPGVAVLVELDRRIRLFKASQRQRYRFTLFSDHGNAHLASQLVEPRDILRAAGVTPVDRLTTAATDGDGPPLEAVPIVHVRVNYVALHTHPARAAEVAARTSLDAAVDLAVAPLDDGGGDDSGGGSDSSRRRGGPTEASGRRFAVWRKGSRYTFRRAADGAITVDEPDRWAWLGADLAPATSPDRARARLDDRQALAATLAGPYPDIFYRVATAFTHPAARYPADVLLSMPDDVASIGFEIPAASGVRANSGFHGSLARRTTLSVLASEGRALPGAVRADDLADLFPALRGDRR